MSAFFPELTWIDQVTLFYIIWTGYPNVDPVFDPTITSQLAGPNLTFKKVIWLLFTIIISLFFIWILLSVSDFFVTLGYLVSCFYQYKFSPFFSGVSSNTVASQSGFCVWGSTWELGRVQQGRIQLPYRYFNWCGSRWKKSAGIFSFKSCCSFFFFLASKSAFVCLLLTLATNLS